ncbi:MAG: FtsW/RodA/SpoVE family cell cycle protein [Rickettsiales bacterium]|jgi:cell division protein FtsW|nr:FtsW/RodA/SpoVE family cell cycle protein [Rickettsiales bacterium]
MRFRRRDPSFLTRWFFQTDREILSAVFILVGVGIYMLVAAGGYAASRIGQPPLFFFWKAMLPMLAGIAALFFFSFLSRKQILWLGAILGAITAALVLATLVSPTCIKGSCRFFSIAGFQVHPSELLKPFFILMTAVFLASKPKWDKFGWPLYIAIAAPLLITILVRKDFGMTLIYAAVFWGMLFFAGYGWKILVLGAGGIAALGMGALAFMPHLQKRIAGGDGYQISKALDSIRSGGFIGRGNSSYVKSDLPDSHTDFVFAAFVEDRGIILGIGLLAIYFWLMFRILKLMRGMTDMTTKLVCGGTIALITMHLALNIGTTLNLTPAKGTILPLVSYGGSAFISMCAVFGILLGMIRGYKFYKGAKK